MRRIVIGFVNQGNEISGMSMVSFKTNFERIFKELDSNLNSIRVLIISDLIDSNFCLFVKKFPVEVSIFGPRDWEALALPPMKNGSFATYWKFDLFSHLNSQEILIYFDSDTFVLNNLNIPKLLERIQLESRPSIGGGRSTSPANGTQTSYLMMVPSHRPVFERIGYRIDPNPYSYFNAGFFISVNIGSIDSAELLRIFEFYYLLNKQELIWHDQDLLNVYFEFQICPLPLSYNISTGMLNRKYFAINQMNYLTYKAFLHPKIVHASGGVLNTTRYYPYRNRIIELAKDLLSNPLHQLSPSEKAEINAFLSQITLTQLRTAWNLTLTILRIYRQKLIVDTERISFLPNLLLRLIRKL